jgi:aldehyde dehydrogenase (NAD+)/betaine-aldehyde dehydrogenase
MRNAGQGCASPTRILVHESVYERFLELSAEVYARVPIGDPWDPATVIGPLIRPEHRDRVEGFVARAVAAGGSVLAGGGRPDGTGEGFFMNAALVGDVPPDAEICQEELFGPVAVVLKYHDVDEAVAIANGTRFGLAAYVFGELEEAKALAPRLRAGTVYVNGGGGIRPDVPFGGWKASSIGREWGADGIREFLEPQHIQWRTA